MKIGIALGSNLGDSNVELSCAYDFLKKLSPSQFLASTFYSSSPVECDKETPSFLNGVVEIEFKDGLIYLLEKLQAYERLRGRPSVREKNSPRPIDLDILYADEMEMQTSRLIIPHPRMTERLFVLEPLAEIRPELILPKQGKSVRVLLEELKRTEHDQVCRKIS